MGVVYLAYCRSWQLPLHVPCFCAFYIFNTAPNPTSSSFFQKCFCTVFFFKARVHVCACMHACMHVCVSAYMHVYVSSSKFKFI